MLCEVTFRPIPSLISCAGVTGRWLLLSHAQNAVMWLALFNKWKLIECYIVQPSFESSHILKTFCTLVTIQMTTMSGIILYCGDTCIALIKLSLSSQ